MNSITESASLDQCVDETLWPHMGFGSEVLHRLVGRQGINKGGQTEGKTEIKSMMDQIQPMYLGRGAIEIQIL
eukprot:11007676-Ditylum_brightwellii.AAC.1